jgi:uncharacterized protein YjlB
MNDARLFRFQDDGSIPNNPSLPVLFYPGAFSAQPEKIEQSFQQHGWGNTWQGGVFGYHHYHSNTHEALGVVSGSARLQLGGERGAIVSVQVGDVCVLPAGTGHKCLEASDDFRIAGAYPGGVEYNLKTGEPDERPYVLEDIHNVPLPRQDPVYGEQGPLLVEWKV